MKKEVGWQEGMVLWSQHKRRGNEPTLFADKKSGRVRVRILMLLLLVVLTSITVRLIYLQIWEGDRQYLFAETNHVELIRETAPRGLIVDRREQPLVQNVLVKEDNGEEKVVREYGYGASVAPVIGYLSEARESELGCRGGLCYNPGMEVGRAGSEKLWENELRGRDGGKVVEYEASGKEVRSVGDTESQPGKTVILSIDARLQQAAYQALAGRKGAVVVLDMQGKVLTLVSSPSYDPNWFTLKSEQDKLSAALNNDKDQLFLNRATSGVYPPGSVFKPILAYAGLMTGELTASELIEDTGEIKIDQYRYGNWYFDQYGKTEGKINVVRALARSNDIFFYKLGERLGVDKIDEWARKFGIGESTGIELPGEVTGLLPTPLWKERTTGDKWFTGNTYHLSIGQGDLLVTPLQIARMALAIVSGRKCQISILRDSAVSCESVGLSKEAEDTVHEGMRQACLPAQAGATGGTAYPFFNFDPPVMCKTGTAQHGGQTSDPSTGSGQVKPHAWIIVGYPAENPQLVMAVFLDSAGEGSEQAAPVAKEVLTKWKELGDK